MVGAPELLEEQPHALADRLQREAVAVPRLLGGEEVPAQGVGAEAVEHLPGRDDVALGLRHLLALGVGDEAEADDALVGGAVEQQRRDRVQRVEPAARLVDRLADVVGGEVRLEDVLVLVRRVPLRERHAARVEPDVDDLGHAAHRLLAVRARERHVVDVGPVRIVEPGARQLLQLGRATRRSVCGRPRSARPAAACPSSARATAPSRRCRAATRRSGRRGCAADARRSGRCWRAAGRAASRSRCTRRAWRSRAAACRSASSAGRRARTARRAAAGRARAGPRRGRRRRPSRSVPRRDRCARRRCRPGAPG